MKQFEEHQKNSHTVGPLPRATNWRSNSNRPANYATGRVYNNEYHTIVTIRDGKIREVREYLDTQHILATWFTP